VYDDAEHYSPASDDACFERTVTVHSFSKSYAMTGWRIGYASGPGPVVDAMRVLQEHTVSSVAEPAQVAAMAALENRDVVEDIHRAFADRRELILERLAAVDGIDAGTPRGAFYVFADVSDLAADSRTFVDALMAEEAGVAAVPGRCSANRARDTSGSRTRRTRRPSKPRWTGLKDCSSPPDARRRDPLSDAAPARAGWRAAHTEVTCIFRTRRSIRTWKRRYAP